VLLASGKLGQFWIGRIDRLVDGGTIAGEMAISVRLHQGSCIYQHSSFTLRLQDKRNGRIGLRNVVRRPVGLFLNKLI